MPQCGIITIPFTRFLILHRVFRHPASFPSEQSVLRACAHGARMLRRTL